MIKQLFISYARKDGRELALKLQRDLQKNEFEVWLDTSEIEGGASWSKEIEDAIDNCYLAIALLSHSSYVSEICRAEQLRCLRKDKALIPLLVQADAERPLYLEHLNYRDFTVTSAYDTAFEQLLADLTGDKLEVKSGKHLKTYTNAPALPLNFVERPDDLARLRQELIADDGERRIALTALQGMGGIGKSALAAWVCRDEVVQAAFPDGVIWVDVGRENVSKLNLIKVVGKELGDPMGHYTSDVEALSQLRKTLPTKSALIVLDDVWDIEHARLFSNIEAVRSRVLFTTRDASIGDSIGASEVRLDVLEPEQALKLLREWAGRDLSELAEIADKLGYLPLALKIAGGRLREMDSTEWLKTFRQVSRLKGGRRAKTAQDNLEVCFDLSVQQLENEDQLHYHALGIFPEDLWIPETVAFKLWRAYDTELSETDCREIARDLHKLALVVRREDDGAMLLHDLLHDYNRVWMNKHNKYQNAHQKLLNAYNLDEKSAWWELEPDGYIYEQLAYHLTELKRLDDLHHLLTSSPDWMEAKSIYCRGESAYVADLELAMKSYDTPFSADNLVRWVQLNTTRQMVNVRVNTIDDDILRALANVGREQEALSYARLRPNPEMQFQGLLAIWYTYHNKGKQENLLLSELLSIGHSISNNEDEAYSLVWLANDLAQVGHFDQAQEIIQSIILLEAKASGLIKLANTLTQAGDKRAKGIFTQAIRTVQVQSIDIDTKAMLLTDLSDALTQAGDTRSHEIFSQALSIVQSISRPSTQSHRLRWLIEALAKTDNDTVRNIYNQVLVVARSNDEPLEQATILTELVGLLIKIEDFQNARELVTLIPNLYHKAMATIQLASALVRYGENVAKSALNVAERQAIVDYFSEEGTEIFNQTLEVIITIPNLSSRAKALGEFALAQVHDKNSKRVFNQALNIILSIKDDTEQAEALTQLASLLVQVHDESAKEIFNQAREIGTAISTNALIELANSCMKVEDFQYARQIILLISNPFLQKNLLIGLATSHNTNVEFVLDTIRSISGSDDENQIGLLIELANSLEADDERAKIFLSQAYKLVDSISVSALINLGSALAKAGSESAEFVLNKGLNAVEKIRVVSSNNPDGDILLKFARAFSQAKDERARIFFDKVYELIHSISDDGILVGLLINLANSLEIDDQKAKILSQAYELANSIPSAYKEAEIVSTTGYSDTRSSVLGDLANAYIAAGYLDQAKKVALSIELYYYNRVEILYAIASAFAKANEFEKALKVTQNISSDDNEGVVFCEMVNIHAKANEFEKALEITQNISSVSSKITSLATIASAMAQVGDDRAEEILNQGIYFVADIPNYYLQTRASIELACVLVQMGNTGKALELGQQVYYVNDFADFLRDVASAMAQAGDKKAIEIFTQAQDMAKSITDVDSQQESLKNIANALIQVGYLTQAYELAQSINYDYEREDVLDELANIYMESGQYLQAVSSFGMRSIEEWVNFLMNWQENLSHSYPEQPNLWQRVMLAALEITCWVRKDYVLVRDILRKEEA